MRFLQKDVFDKVLHDVIKFCQNQDVDNEALPTCALVTGVNLPDHKDLFKLLCKKIKKKVSEHVACVRSSDCNTLKTLVKKILLALHRNSAHGEDDSSDEEDEDEGDDSKVKKFTPTLSNLSTWYENQYDGTSSKPPLVIIFEDFEGFSSVMLQDLIANLQ